MTELVHYEVADRVGTITLDSPHNRNALSRQLLAELFGHLETAESDDAIALVIRSADRVFCSGADLSEAGSAPMEEGVRAIVELQRRIVTHPKPVVARLAGPVRAGGLGIVGASDVVICQDDVTFAFTESRLALAPAAISLSLLPRLNPRAAGDVFLTGRTFGADEAAAMGLVTRSVPAGELDAAVAEAVAGLLEAHPQGLRETKQVLAAPVLDNIDAHGEAMVELSARLFGSDEAREAVLAFLSRKK